MPKYVSTRSIKKGIYRKRWRAKQRKRWVGTVAAAAPAGVARSWGQVI